MQKERFFYTQIYSYGCMNCIYWKIFSINPVILYGIHAFDGQDTEVNCWKLILYTACPVCLLELNIKKTMLLSEVISDKKIIHI